LFSDRIKIVAALLMKFPRGFSNKNNNRAPLTLRLDSYWFSFTKNGYEGFTKFLNEVGKLDDVFLVSVQDVVDWIKNSVW
jgi:hypothetical protein